ncbi:MAG: hypothetical protein M3010_04995, partial [Candidatus Dormibacteraeota bacterium]|nr:hypothetical protein [Candidatus Dormibacteraeota bacterium]
MARPRVSLALVGALALLSCAPVAGATTGFRPRIGGAMGLLPARNHSVSPPPVIPIVYHGGAVMRGATLHTIFWAPRGFHFSGALSPSVPSYTGLVQQ